MITGGSSMPERFAGAAMIFKAPPQFGQWSMSMSKTRYQQPGPTQARRRALRVIACGRGCLLWRTGDDFTTQLCVRREHAMEAGEENTIQLEA
jgi:hypothetical protein